MDTSTLAMEDLFSAQRQAFNAAPNPTLEQRIGKLKRLKQALVRSQDALIAAVDQDYGGRSHGETRFAEFITLAECIEHTIKHLGQWMRPQKRRVPWPMQPAQAKVLYQPLGIVGIITPWNYPYLLSIGPLVGALGAGNCAMIKMSEFTPNAGAALDSMLAEIFPETEVAVIHGDVAIAQAFSKLPFDHLLFTGSTTTGKRVMAAAAENLTPVTLELGGKSPALIHDSFPLKEAAERIAWGKCMNAGQSCVATDYALVPEAMVEDFANAFVSVVSGWYPKQKEHNDFTAILGTRHRERLLKYLADAEQKGARLITINPANEDFSDSNKLPHTLVLNTTPDMLVEQEEIFGPLLVIKPYQSLDEAVAYINSRPRPLAFYYFDYDSLRTDKVLANTHSGGACVNDTLNQVAVEDLPFGGLGPSGMGSYHGHSGFLRFSHCRGVFSKGKVNPTKLMFPPWNRPIHRLALKKFLR